jgi:hypothetical protein
MASHFQVIPPVLEHLVPMKPEDIDICVDRPVLASGLLI